jgi:hypothetical protein
LDALDARPKREGMAAYMAEVRGDKRLAEAINQSFDHPCDACGSRNAPFGFGFPRETLWACKNHKDEMELADQMRWTILNAIEPSEKPPSLPVTPVSKSSSARTGATRQGPSPQRKPSKNRPKQLSLL